MTRGLIWFVLDVWGFDEEAVKILLDMKPDEGTDALIKEYAILLDVNSPLRLELENRENVCTTVQWSIINICVAIWKYMTIKK